MNAACSGFVYALVQAHGMIAMGAKKVLVIGTDTLARITDWTDRNTAILFADGSAAVVLEAVEGHGQLLGWDLDAKLPVLATYMGHLDILGTQHYLHLTAELFPEITSRSQAHFGDVIPRRVVS